MEDIYGKMRDKINNPSEIKATEKDWNSFLAHREARDVVPFKKAVWPYWIMGLLFLLFGLSNAYWITKKSNSNILQNDSITSTDTIYITKYVDKVTSVISENESLIQSSNLFEELALIKNKYQALKYEVESQKSRFSQLLFNNQDLEYRYRDLHNQLIKINNNGQASLDIDSSFDTKVLGQNKPVFESKLEERIFLNIIGQLPRLGLGKIAGNDKPIIYPSSITIIKNEKPFNLLDAITPKSFGINTNVGYGFNPSDDDYKSLAFDLRATSLFSSYLRGFARLTLLESRSRLDENDTSNPNIPYPTIPEDDEIEHSDEIVSQLSFTLGMEYLLNFENRWRPFVGLGYGRVFKNSARYSFEIYDANDNEYYITPESKNALGSYDQIIFTLGTDFNISNRIDMRLGLNYTHSLHNKYNSIFLLKGGAYYHF